MKRTIDSAQRSALLRALAKPGLAMTILLACFALAACGKKKDEPAPAPTPPAPPPVAAGSGSAAPAAEPPAPPPPEVPTEQDFETQAKTDIDEKNVDTKVKAIEQDLAQ